MKKLLVGSAMHLEFDGLRDLEYLLYNFPFICRLNCEICCNKNRKAPLSEMETLSKNELILIVEESARLGARVFGSMGLGEPLISPNFDLLVKTAHENGMIPYIFTTAFNLNEKMTEFLDENGTSLIIHLDSLQKQRYHEFYGGQGDLGTVLINIDRARKSYSGGTDRLSRLAINMVVRRKNVDEVQDIARFCGEDIAFVTNTLLDRTDHGYLSEDDIYDRTEIKTIPLGTTNNFCEYLDRGITIYGRNILVCPYSDIRIGRITDISDVAKQIGKASQFVRDFYIEHGNSRCFVRHPDCKEAEIRGNHD